ncbi:MAG: hypothetical protein ACRC0B_01595 [Legionella sp.]
MSLTRKLFFAALLTLTAIAPTHAEETDQFTLPPDELVDLGAIASNRLYGIIEQLIKQTNMELRLLQARAPNSRHAAKKLVRLQQGSYIADALYKQSGPGFPRWFPRQKITGDERPIMYKESRPWKTVYWLAFSQSPLSLIGLAPTINMYGHYIGTDKLGHFFMQGHTYYKMYQYFLAHGKSSQQAQAAIVTYGKILESTYLGVLVNGVYSNGDLAANYSGWKFYSNLSQSVTIGTRTLPPILVLRDNQWHFSNWVHRDQLLKPYFSDILNEAYNPCRYTFSRAQIRRQINKRCGEWIAREGLTAAIAQTKLHELKKWHGEDYGHWLPASSAVTLNTCFGGQ